MTLAGAEEALVILKLRDVSNSAQELEELYEDHVLRPIKVFFHVLHSDLGQAPACFKIRLLNRQYLP